MSLFTSDPRYYQGTGSRAKKAPTKFHGLGRNKGVDFYAAGGGWGPRGCWNELL